MSRYVPHVIAVGLVAVAGGALVSGSLLVLAVVAVAGGVAVAWRRSRAASLALAAGLFGAFGWVLVGLIAPDASGGTIWWHRPEMTLPGGVTVGGELTSTGAWAIGRGALGCLVVAEAVGLAWAWVPGRRWHDLVRDTLGAIGDAVAPLCYLGEAADDDAVARSARDGWGIPRGAWVTAWLLRARELSMRPPVSRPGDVARWLLLLAGAVVVLATRSGWALAGTGLGLLVAGAALARVDERAPRAGGLLSLDRLEVWLPSRGQVLHPVTLTASGPGVVAVVGRGGAGASTLLAAATGTLPLGALTRGNVLASGIVQLDEAPADRAREARDAGGLVVWATRDLDAARAVADRIIELHEGRVVADSPADTWTPRHQPIISPAPGMRRGAGGESLGESLVVDPAVCAVAGEPFIVGPRECVGFIGGDLDSVAARLGASLGADVLAHSCPTPHTPRQVLRVWETRHPGTTAWAEEWLADSGVRLLLDVPLADQSDAAWPALRAALAATTPGPLVVLQASRGLDAAERRRLADWLATGAPGPRIITGGDAGNATGVAGDGGFLSLACARLVEISLDPVPVIVAVGTPAAVVGRKGAR